MVGTGSSYDRVVSSLNIVFCQRGAIMTAHHLMIHCPLATGCRIHSCLGFLLLGSPCHHWVKFTHTALKDLG